MKKTLCDAIVGLWGAFVVCIGVYIVSFFIHAHSGFLPIIVGAIFFLNVGVSYTIYFNGNKRLQIANWVFFLLVLLALLLLLQIGFVYDEPNVCLSVLLLILIHLFVFFQSVKRVFR
ncbi:hypothetical protein QNI16_21430 [Cytophagaceae bacterium YF14B1]|uniref:Uncharacterized protein n=1 Tax=Xanthocytophaga flava TaxID=3048013 RepID=A0AAE3QPV9_9BACT|nr:hypothetical protein [Xanthocytophaga flavus]MDJ1483075.1 hypothetical protein [Xanthocytophaga flavus]